MNNSGIDGFEAGIWQQVIYRMTDGLCCFYVLWVQLNQKENLSLQRELDGIRFMWQQQERQYEITSDTIENINRKCHDLKYQIHNLSDITDETEKREYLQELERDIMIYDVSLQTGNRALDVVLMEKGLFCKNHEIQWSCMVDGSRMNFMKAEDIYGIFGNALDNAIEAVSRLEDPQQRVISVKAIYQKKILVIQFQNYYQGDLEFRNGIPRTTKQNKQDHGYGMKSIRYTVEKYNGTVTVSTKNNIFTLQILIPLA
ncbi:MAG: ATP-binding protein [Waltera sp.]